MFVASTCTYDPACSATVAHSVAKPVMHTHAPWQRQKRFDSIPTMFRALFACSALLAVVVVGKEAPEGRPPKKEADPNWQPNPFKSRSSVE